VNCSARSVVSGACARLEEVQIRGYGKYLNKRICKAVEANMMPTVSSSLTSGDCEFFFTRTIGRFDESSCSSSSEEITAMLRAISISRQRRA
jgi:hypothetical protein